MRIILRLQEVSELLKSNPRGAVIKLTRAIALQPKNAELFRQRAEAYEALFDYHPAILNFRKALLLGPLNKEALTFRLAEVYCAYGERLCEGKQHLQALEMFKMALEYQPHNREYALKRYSEYACAQVSLAATCVIIYLFSLESRVCLY